MLKLPTASLLAASFMLPVMAQTSVPASQNHASAALNAPATHDTAGSPAASGSAAPSACNNTVTTDNGSLRASKIVGSAVYNDHDQKIGSIDDLVIGSDYSLQAVVSVGGFLGIGSKMVAVPFNRLDFGNPQGSGDNRIVLPGSSKEKLTAMPDFHYTNRG
jgi:PRC-barrel domain